MASFDWKALVGSVAPTIATAFYGPLAGMAVKAVGDAIGIEKPTDDAMSAALAGATPEMLAKIKAADQDFAEKMKSLNVDLERLAAADRDSARKMQIDVRSKVPALMALLVTVGFFGVLLGLMGGWLHTGDSNELLILLGALAASWGSVINFYFGSSAQSHIQTRILGEKVK